MRFWTQQTLARRRTVRWLLILAGVCLALGVAVNGSLALLYRALFPWTQGWPRFFFATNTGVLALFVVGGWWTESVRLREGGGQRVARWLGAVPVPERPDSPALQRLRHVVDEMALASGQQAPCLLLLPRETAINALVAGWSPQDTVLCITQGALDQLDRQELQGLVAHEFGHLAERDARLCMHLLAVVWGLSLVHTWGRHWMTADDGAPEGDEPAPRWPATWLFGAVLAALGWLGWVAARLLQAAISREREHLADARAVQFTRSRDGLGQVLRKLLYLSQQRRQGMVTPQADHVAFLWLQAPRAQGLWRTHPTLTERIRRVHGAQRPALPCLPPGQAVVVPPEPSRPVPPVPSAPPALHAPSAPSATEGACPDALARLARLAGPLERQMALLGLMTTPGNDREHLHWTRLAQGLAAGQATRLLQDLQALPAAWRLPQFERLVGLAQRDPVARRRELVSHARDLLKADGRVSACDRLWWLYLRHRLNEGVGVWRGALAPLRPGGDLGADLDQLRPLEVGDVATLSAYLSRLVPVTEGPDAAGGSLGAAWWRSVMRRCRPGEATGRAGRPMPDADALVSALQGVQELSWRQRPQLMKAWVEEALNHSPDGLLNPAAADALRLMAGLIDTPLPPALSAHFPRSDPARPVIL